MSKPKYLYTIEEVKKDMKAIVGGKGANLGEMYSLGIPVPYAIMISTKACLDYFEKPNFLEEIKPDVMEYVRNFEKKVGKKFGDKENPLLVSVRSGAAISMPGMMDTILNLGINDEIAEALIKKTGNERFVLDSYRRFIQMFSDVVKGIPHEDFEEILTEEKHKIGPNAKDNDLKPENLRNVISNYKKLYKEKLKEDFPQDPIVQLFGSIEAVFKSWNNPRALVYRKMNKIGNIGTAVNIQMMVFGNMNDLSMTGVAFTRDPSTGENVKMGEYLVNAQGEDVVAGIRTPKKIEELQKEPGLKQVYDDLMSVMEKLEKHFRDMQDIEFTAESGKLYMLQTRNGKRTATAMVKVAVDLLKEGLINEEETLLRIDADRLSELLFKRVDPKAKYKLLTKGLNASPGAVTGEIVFTADEAVELAAQGKKVILVRPETKPDDIHGLKAALGVLTERGGKTSHAAVVARGMGKPAVCGAVGIKINLKEEKMFCVDKDEKEIILQKGDLITIDGLQGLVIEGKAPLLDPEIGSEMSKILEIADKKRKLGVRSNADTPEDARNSIKFGAEGIGLCRTEHMFMAAERLPIVQQMIMAKTREERIAALAKIEVMQETDFYDIFKIMENKPVTIRLLDPPLHEFLPEWDHVLSEVAVLRYRKAKGEAVDKELEEKEKLLALLSTLKESNPMMGLRGCRLGLKWPEINEMQVRAIFKAATRLKKEGHNVIPEIMIPLIVHINELKEAKRILVKVAKEVIEKASVDIEYKFGTMIEVPRAALTAAEIAEEAEFFSFGTNDLTQMTFGFSRDDAENKFLAEYLEQGILKVNPFQELDRNGPGKLLSMAVKDGRATRANLKCGICGEHGGDPNSIEWCHMNKLNYVSCSPFRLIIARVAAGIAAIKEAKGEIKMVL
jgi:pyruvate,orthophosphate dikinase